MSAARATVLSRLGPTWSVDVPFERDAPLVVEIGAGFGRAAVAFARQHPERNFVACEIHRPGVAELLMAIDELGLANVRVHAGDAIVYLGSLPPASVDELHLFFPDPWPKARHHKRRFVRPDLIDLVANRLARGSRWLLATDDAAYGDVVDDLIGGDDRFELTSTERPSWRPDRGFEARATSLDRPVREWTFTRC